MNVQRPTKPDFVQLLPEQPDKCGYRAMSFKWGVILALSLFITAPWVEAADNEQDSRITPRIVGGQPADPQDWKFYTQIVNRNSNRSFCGASYIGNGYVLTAAHCVDNDAPSQIAVKIGGIRYNGTDGTRVNVREIHLHPNFNSTTLANDIALLKLSSELSNMTAVNIAAGSLSQYVSIGDSLTVAGLGRTSEGGSSPSVLQAVDVPLVSDGVCRQAGGSYGNIGSVSFCAGVPQGGMDSCQGDSGGPIVTQRGGNIVQLGIVSWGVGCARPGKYGVYSDIAALRSFVDSVIAGGQPSLNVVYQAQQTLASFVVGERKAHTFLIQNAGVTPFTVDQVRLGASGVTTQHVLTQDGCSMTTLTRNQSCQVAVEFSASRAGDAVVSLDFDLDKASQTYRALVTAKAALSSTTCDTDWLENQIYQAGDTVTWAGQLWQAQWWTSGEDPANSGPWGAWQPIAASACQGQAPVDPPVTSPIEPKPPTTPNPPTSGNNVYQAGVSYGSGDVVTNNGVSYQCKPWPSSLWCGSSPAAYEPGVGSNWHLAWNPL